MYVALETGWLPDETLIDFGGAGFEGSLTDRPTEESVGLAEVGDSLAIVWVPAVSEAASDGGPLPISAAEVDAAWPDDTKVWWQPVVRRVSVPGAKLSFSTLGAETLRQAMSETARELSGLDSFAGFAVHYSESYQRLLYGE